MAYFKKVLLCAGLLLLSSSLWSQSNEVIDDFLGRDEADTGTAVLLIGQALGELPDTAGVTEAMTWAQSQSWKGKISKFEPEDPITLGRYFVALFQSFDIKGGMMYSLFKSPRHAALEAEYKGYLGGTPYYTRTMTPQEVLFSLSMAMDANKEEEAADE